MKNILRHLDLMVSSILLVTGIAISMAVVLTLLLLKPEVLNDDSKSTHSLNWSIPNIETDLPEGNEGKLISYGHKLISESPKWMGPLVKSPGLQYAGNNLTCSNCHLDDGTRPGAASWVGVAKRFPQFRGRENRLVSLEDRVNGCMERSMNGKALPEDSKQMEAIVAYINWLSEDFPEEKEPIYIGFPKLDIPVFQADPEKGKIVYANECQVCHGEMGKGLKLADSTKGYQYPPLWGEDSYNHGAGMGRVLTAAQYIKGNMPWGQASYDRPKLSDEEAFHVAAYINSFDRPKKQDTENDFPDLKLKPVSTSYGPWVDSFPEEQHKYGPFPPIIAYYQKEYQISKSK